MFNGFSQKTSDFLWDLSFNNERPWFLEHKSEFEDYVNTPFKELSKAVYEKMAERYPDADWQVHISRIYRDARRLFGRGPYKDHLWFTVWDEGSDKHGPAFWFEISPKDFSYGMGFWMTRPEHMEAYRKSILANPARFERLALDVESHGKFMVIGESYKKPKGDMGEVINPWFNRKYVAIEHNEDFGSALFTPDFADKLAEDFSALIPMYHFFCEFYSSTRKAENDAD